jgi:hypothetical protein
MPKPETVPAPKAGTPKAVSVPVDEYGQVIVQESVVVQDVYVPYTRIFGRR